MREKKRWKFIGSLRSLPFFPVIVSGLILFLWEEDEENEHVIVDEATIMIGGIEETFGLYFLGGRYYPHFGEFNTFLVSDPLTLAVRYGGSQGMYGLFPEHQLAASISYELFKYTALSAEYSHGSYDLDNLNGDGMVEEDVDIFMLQLAIEFP